MARKIATNTVASRDELLDFIRTRHHAIVITARDNVDRVDTAPTVIHSSIS